MVYRLVGVDNVIAKVLADNDIQEGVNPVSDYITYAGEALEKIGAFPQFINKVTGKDGVPILELSNYQCRLPYDFHQLIQAAYGKSASGPFYPMRKATGSMEWAVEMNKTTANLNTVADSALVTVAMTLYDISYEEALAKINNDTSVREQLEYLLKNKTVSAVNQASSALQLDYTYVINNSYIKTNQQDGYIMLSYQAVPVDINGYPMIPDMPSFFEAIYWYITMKLMYPKWAAGQVRDAVYYDAKRSWNFYRKQAYAEALMPDRDELETIKNTWVRLVPNINEHSTFYNSMGQQEIVWNSNRI